MIAQWTWSKLPTSHETSNALGIRATAPALNLKIFELHEHVPDLSTPAIRPMT